jgi:hypothetical protein
MTIGENTAFKNFDPFHPCPKCRAKHSKPCAGTLSYTRWSNSSSPLFLEWELPDATTTFPKFLEPAKALKLQPVELVLHQRWSNSIQVVLVPETIERAMVGFAKEVSLLL